MKKKLLACIIGFSVATVGAATLAACGSDSQSSVQDEYQQVYSHYVANAEESGETPLTYDEWLLSIKGPQGDKGDKGDKGDTGDTGAVGDTGSVGATGKSAYEVWIDAGNTGSELDFINWLKGPQGQEGNAGTAGDAGLDVEDVQVRVVEIKGNTYFHFIITMSDESRINRFESAMVGETLVASICQQETDIDLIKEGDQVPEIKFDVTYTEGDPEVITLDELNIIYGELSLTESGEQTIYYEYKGFYGKSTFSVYDPLDTSIVSVEILGNSRIWFTNMSDEENLQDVRLCVKLGNGNVSYLNVTSDMVTKTNMYDNNNDIYYTVTYEGFENKLYIMKYSRTIADLLASSMISSTSVTYSGPTQIQIPVGGNPFNSNCTLRFTTLILDRVFNFNMAPTVQMLWGFNPDIPSDYRDYYIDPGFYNVINKSPAISISVFVDIEGATVVRLSNIYFHYRYTPDNSLPNIKIQAIYDNDARLDIPLTEDMITNRDEVDFSVHGEKILDVTYSGISTTTRIVIYNPEVDNIRSAGVHSNDLVYTLGDDVVEFKAKLDALNMYIGFYEPVNGDTVLYVPVSECTYDLDTIDFTKVGKQELKVYYEFNDEPICGSCIITVAPDLTELEPIATYTCDARFLKIYSNGYCEIYRTDTQLLSNYSAYTIDEDNNTITFSEYGLEYVYTIDGTNLYRFEVSNSVPIKSYRGRVGLHYVVIEVYEDYLTYCITDSTYESNGYIYTAKMSSVENNQFIIIDEIMLMTLNDDGTISYRPAFYSKLL